VSCAATPYCAPGLDTLHFWPHLTDCGSCSRTFFLSPAKATLFQRPTAH
jgi:hypothetical protein